MPPPTHILTGQPEVDAGIFMYALSYNSPVVEIQMTAQVISGRVSLRNEINFNVKY